MIKNRSLKWRLIFGSTIISTIILMILSIAIYSVTYKSSRNNIEKTNEIYFKNINDIINISIDDSVTIIDNLNGGFIDITKDASDIQKKLNFLSNSNTAFASVKLLDTEGKLLYTAPQNDELIGSSFINEEFYINRPEKYKTSWSDIHICEEHNHAMICIVSSLDGYIIMADLDLSSISKFIDSESLVGVIDLSILDSFGNYIFSTESRHVEQRLRYNKYDQIKSMVSDVSTMTIIDLDGMLITTKSIGQNNEFFVVLEQDKSIIYGDAKKMVVYIAVTLLLMWVTILVLLGKNLKLLVHDLSGFSLLANRIADGSYEINTVESVFQEFQELETAFVTMGDQIQQREEEIVQINNSLEEAVVERTGQLRLTNQELQDVNAQLEEEIMEREKAEGVIASMNDELEGKVEKRTAQLRMAKSMTEEINTQLEEEIEEHSVTINLLEEKELAVNQALRLAEEANDSKGQFLANMSHEIRTPMNGILGMVDVMTLTYLSSEQQGYLKTIKASSDTLLTVLNDILDYTKIEANKVEINNKPFDMTQMLEDVYNLFSASAKHNKLEFELVRNNNIPRYLVGDINRLRQIISNLVGNAVKFTKKGSVKIKISAEKIVGDDVALKIDVIDTGIGIPEENKVDLFTRFNQVQRVDGQKTRGTGLGLSISKMLIELMKGSIEFASSEGVGSKFTVKLDLKKANGVEITREKEANKHHRERVKFENLDILVVEDDITSLSMMKILLGKLDIRVTTAENGEVALAMIKKYKFDLIFMDINMPILNGIVTTEIIRKNKYKDKNHKELTIIAMTAYAIGSDKQKCLDAGMNDYLSKPVNMNDMLDKIRLYTESSTNIGVMTRVAINKEQSANISYNIKTLMSETGFDEKTCKELVNAYLEQGAGLIDHLKIGISDQDDDVIHNTIHKLIGSSGNVRFYNVMNFSEHLMELANEKDYAKLDEKVTDLELIFEGLNQAN